MRDVDREMACTIAAKIAGDEAHREPLALATYGRELLKRLAGDYEGAEVLVLWRRFAWTRTGAPKKNFELTADAIMRAAETIRTSIRRA